ncbi:MAG: ECF-type sigma factor, partial [Planctomycetota bacterium]
MSEDNISLLIKRIKDSRSEEATADLWHVYYDQLVNVARRNLGSLPKRAADEDDVAQSAMFSFFRAAEAGRLTGVEHRDELWKLLLTIVIRKANRQKEKAAAQKRGSGDVRGESVFYRPGEGESSGLADAAADFLTPEVLVGAQELLDLLDD